MSVLVRYRGITTEIVPAQALSVAQAKPAPVAQKRPMYTASYGYGPTPRPATTPAFFSLGRLAQLTRRFASHPIYQTISRSNAGLGDSPGAGNKSLRVRGYQI
ncbi:MAG: hypothetical protein JWO78_293 [Micavibrio sp.]|nr:hypothetical protein [Micavibrio sp.]